MEIFKYTGSHGLKILENCQLKVCDPRYFNDPFEFCPQDAPSITRGDVEAKFADIEFLTNVYQHNHKIRQKCPRGVGDFLNSVRDEKTWWIEFFLKNFTDPKNFLPTMFVEIAARHLGVICFSQTCDDILMWSHYGDYHRGMVIEFDPGSFGAGNLDPVEYAIDRPIYSPVFDVSGCKHLIAVMRRKSDHWAHEKEVRFLVDWDETKENALENGEKIRTLEIAPTAIRRVILGYMAEQPLLDQTKIVLADEKFSHVLLQVMARDTRMYKLHPTKTDS